MKRQFDPALTELMDRPQPVSRELESDLDNLRQLNRFFGSHALIRRFLRHWIKTGESKRVLDLATASGDIPRVIADHARRVGAVIQIDAIDQQESTLEVARQLSQDYPEITYHCADVLQFGGKSAYDIVLCSLALHHFNEEDAARLLQRCLELTTRFVLVSDLRRGFLATVGVSVLTTLFFRDQMTRYDARLSAQRAFSFGELRALGRKAGWKHFHHRRFRFARQAIWFDRREA